MFEVETGFRTTVLLGTFVSRVSIGRDTVTGGADGVGVCAEAAALSSNEAVTASGTIFQLV